MIWHDAARQDTLNRISQGTLPHALLVVGDLGSGCEQFISTVTLRLLCLEPSAQGACGSCQSCQLMQDETHPDCYRLAEERIKIDDIRRVQQKCWQTGQLSPNKVVLIQPAHALTRSAAACLLKTLEEPPAHTTFILETCRLGQLMPTLVSRCHRLRLTNPSRQQALEWCRQQTDCDPDIASLLDVYANAPMAALNSPGWAFFQCLQNDLLQVKGNLNQLRQHAEKYEKIELEFIFTGLFYWLQKWSVDANPPCSLQNLTLFWDYCLEKRQNCLEVATINKRLLLEATFIRWQEICSN